MTVPVVARQQYLVSYRVRCHVHTIQEARLPKPFLTQTLRRVQFCLTASEPCAIVILHCMPKLKMYAGGGKEEAVIELAEKPKLKEA
jgi:hypothetical protein